MGNPPSRGIDQWQNVEIQDLIGLIHYFFTFTTDLDDKVNGLDGNSNLTLQVENLETNVAGDDLLFVLTLNNRYTDISMYKI